jgi:hypothetical protein
MRRKKERGREYRYCWLTNRTDGIIDETGQLL